MAMSGARQLAAEKIDFRGWSAVEITNGLVRLVAVPAIGGRVMAYDLGDHAFLFVDPALAGKLFTPEENQGDGSLAAWKNYGGDKTWPAPQGWDTDAQWHGPPDPVLDTGVYELEGPLRQDGTRCTLAMTSPPDPRTGIQIRSSFALEPHSTRVQVELAFHNIGARSVRWGIWDVVQLEAGRAAGDGGREHDPTCCVTAPVNPNSSFAQGYHVMFGAADNPQWQVEDGLFRAQYQWQIGKVGLDSPGGWIAFYQGSRGVAFAARFAHWPGAEYPDGGATIECWTVGAGQVGNLDYTGSGIYLMEAEVLSPLYTIAPGATARFALEWGSCACGGPVRDVQPGGCTTARLRVTHVPGGVEIEGQFGVFDVGELHVVWRFPDGREEWRESLGRVHPQQPITLAQRCAPPPPGAQLELYVIAEGDGIPRLLAQS
jgi:hypothetical protein